MRAVLTMIVGIVATASMAAFAQERDDKFSWLLPMNGEQALSWSRAQTAATTSRLEGSPTFRTVVADIRSIQKNSAALPSYYRVGDRFLRLTQDRSHPGGLLETAVALRSGMPGAWRTAFDLDAFNRTSGKAYTIKWLDPVTECRAPTFDRCMLPLWPNGGQFNEYRELDLVAGRLVDDGFKVGPSRTSLAWYGPDTLLVAHSTEGAPALASQFPAELHAWRRGTTLAAAPAIFRAPPTSAYLTPTVVSAAGRPHILVSLAESYTRYSIHDVSILGEVRTLPLPAELKHAGIPVATGDGFAVQLAEPRTIAGRAYPTDTILFHDLTSGRTRRVAVPPAGVVLSGRVVGSRSGVLFVGRQGLRQLLFAADIRRGEWTTREIAARQPGITLELEGGGALSGGALLREQGLLTPPRVSVVGTVRAPTLIAEQKPYMDLSGYVVDARAARSSDGVAIDYYLMHRRTVSNVPTPTILQGYGGFGVTNDPAYFGYRMGAALKTWFDRGGALAIAAVRGGGERGAAWHLAGAGTHKRQMVDDFDAVATDLQASGFTDARHLGITGHSNGGLLVAAAAAARPDLYGAVLIGAPITDLFAVGHGDGSIAAGMKTELGDADDPAQAPGMRSWSPQQNIRAGVRYPPTLAYVASNDAQVGPGHARRFVARLQEVGSPAMLLEGAAGGHDFPNEVTQTHAAAMLMTFIIDNTMQTPVSPTPSK